MPSRPRANETKQSHDVAHQVSDRTVTRRRGVWRLEMPAPKLPAIPTVTAVGGGGGLTAAIATGHVQASVVWPAVVLAIAGMAYDVAIRALASPKQG
jgi:hypothetical protein